MEKHKVLILGAGSGGISVAARLMKKLGRNQITIVDPSTTHFYQPLWTLVGAGLVRKETTKKSQKDVIPKGVNWIQDSVARVEPKTNAVYLASGKKIQYEYLIVATGLRLAWERIEGVEGNLGRNGLCSIYQYDQVDEVAKQIQTLTEGTALFVMPPVPIKCAGAPQKIMYLAEDLFNKRGVREKIQVKFATAGKVMFGVPVFSQALTKIVEERKIQPLYQHKIIRVDAANKRAVFSVINEKGEAREEIVAYNMLHIVPPMEAHPYVAESGLAFENGDQKGWLEVNKETLQHLKYQNIFGIGDVTGVPNSKTGAAIRSQYPIVAQNLLDVMANREPTLKYNGYSSCPLVTEVGKVMLAEFGYDGKLMPTFPFMNAAKPRTSMWFLKKNLLPVLYWEGMLKGRA